MSGVIRSASLTNYAEVARKCGLDPARMLREFALPARCLDDPEPDRAHRRGARAAGGVGASAAASRDSALLMAETRRLSSLGPLGLLIREQPTPRLALEAFVQPWRAAQRFAAPRPSRMRPTSWCCGRRSWSATQARSARRPSLRSASRSACCSTCSDRLASAPGLLRARCAWPTVRFTTASSGAYVEFGHDFNGIVCARSDLARPNDDADPELARLAQRMLDGQARLRAQWRHRSQVREPRRDPARHRHLHHRPRRAAPRHRPAHHPPAARSARAQTFSGIVDAVRREFAERYLEDQPQRSPRSRSLLGFSAPSGFSHWYRRQYDATPSSRRAGAKPGPRRDSALRTAAASRPDPRPAGLAPAAVGDRRGRPIRRPLRL